MKTAKTIFTILLTFTIAFLLSALYEFEFFTKNWVRFGLVLIFILLVLALGFLAIISDYRPSKSPE
ncbi:MAG: hypothetical protein EOO51_12635 [Flavobacterium sp.]|nr:MAG: hypothetical protein EOO51_12635 [Flavobacterium sp.]